MSQNENGNLTETQADLLIRSLKNAKDDTTKINHLLKLAEYNIMKPGEIKSDLNSAAGYVARAHQVNLRIGSEQAEGYIFMVEAMLKREEGDLRHGKALIDNAINLLKRSKDTIHLGDAYKELSVYFDYTIPAELAQKTKAVEMAISYFRKDGPSLKLASNMQFLADLYLNQFRLDEGIATVKGALANYQAVRYANVQGVYIILSRLYAYHSNYKEAYKYSLLALKTAENVNDTTMQISLIYNITGELLTRMNDFKKALVYFKEALKVARRYDDHNGIILTVRNIVVTYNKSGNYNEALQFMKSIPPREFKTTTKNIAVFPDALYCEVYTYLKKYPLAGKYAEILVRNFSQQPDLMAPILIRYFTATGQYELAKLYIKKGINEMDMQQREIPKQLQKYFELSYLLDSTKGSYKSALSYLLKANRIKDSLLNENTNRQFKRLEVEFETDKKVSEIKILNQKAQIQNTSLQKANLVKNITIGGILLMLLITSLLFRQYRLKQKGNLIVQQTNIRINEKNKLLEHLLKEKEWLLKEVHHRVKNNLHTVICLLESQAVYLENDALKAVENSQHRIYAMSLIHQKLYQSEDIKSINMAAYLPEFVHYLGDSFGVLGRIRFQLSIESLQLGISQAIPLALIVNEAVTNAIKYAFKETNKGLIEISFYQEGNLIKLIIADDGTGIKNEFIQSSTGSLGLNLIKGLSEDINGQLKIENRNGTRFTIEFATDPITLMGNQLESVLQG